MHAQRGATSTYRLRCITSTLPPLSSPVWAKAERPTPHDMLVDATSPYYWPPLRLDSEKHFYIERPWGKKYELTSAKQARGS